MASRKLSVFIGCSEEALPIAKAIQAELESWCRAQIWTQGQTPSATIIENLEANLSKHDAAIVILTPDDVTKKRGYLKASARDNVIFELGLFMGALGRERTFIVLPETIDLRLPTDLDGIISATYDPDHTPLQASIGPACSRVEEALGTAGPRARSRSPADFEEILVSLSTNGAVEVDKLLKQMRKLTFQRNVIRRNWTIHLDYDVSDRASGIIRESILWDYELCNLLKRPVDVPIKLTMLDDPEQHKLVEMSIQDEDGLSLALLDSGAKQEVSGGWLTKRTKRQLEPNITYHIRMRFEVNYPVSAQKPYVHNSFASSDGTIGARLTANVPEGYQIDVLGVTEVTPGKAGAQRVFVFREPLLPEQIIEYVFQEEKAQ